MVVWELTLATAYFLGLKRAYRLSLKLEKKLLRRYPRALDFAQRRTRNVFDIAYKVHKEIQRRDLSAGRSLGNCILRMLDRIRPSADIRGSITDKQSNGSGSSRSINQAHIPGQHTQDKEPVKGSKFSDGNLKFVRTFLNHNKLPLTAFQSQLDIQSRTGGSGIPKLLSGNTSSLAALSLQNYASSLEKSSKYILQLQSHSATPARFCRLPFIEPIVSQVPCLKGVIRVNLAKWILASCRR